MNSRVTAVDEQRALDRSGTAHRAPTSPGLCPVSLSRRLKTRSGRVFPGRAACEPNTGPPCRHGEVRADQNTYCSDMDTLLTSYW